MLVEQKLNKIGQGYYETILRRFAEKYTEFVTGKALKVVYPELGDRTIYQALLLEKYDEVHALVDRLMSMPVEKAPRGLSFATPEVRKRAAKLGGQTISQNRQHMSEIGKKGGTKVSQNKEHMREIGRKGGTACSKNKDHMKAISLKGVEAKRAKALVSNGATLTDGDEQARTND